MPNRKLPSDFELYELFKTHSIAELAEKFNCKYATVARKIAKIATEEQRYGMKFTERYSRIKTLLDEGKTIAQIARIMGEHRNNIVRFATTYELIKKKPEIYYHGIPLGCSNCISRPAVKGLCWQCYRRYRARHHKLNLPGQILLYQDENYTIIYNLKDRLGKYLIEKTEFKDHPHPHHRQPNQLEERLLHLLYLLKINQLDTAYLQSEVDQYHQSREKET